MKLEGYIDANLCGDSDTSKSTFGYVSIVGGTAVSWMSKLHKCISLSTT